MRHSIHVEGSAFGLRPVELPDASFIVQMRTADPSRTRYVHPISPDVELQRAWLAAYFQRGGDYYWVIERRATHQPEGLIGVYDMNHVASSAEWGRWILRPASLAAVESALLIYRVAFEQLKLDSLYCLTVADNQPVVSFHDSCGLRRAGILKAHFKLGEKSFDAVKHILVRQEWDSVRDRLAPQAQRIAQRFNQKP